MCTSFSIQEDELLHSYIIRLLFIHGELNQASDINNILDKEGVLKKNIVIPPKWQYIFKSFSFETRFKWFEKHHLLNEEEPFRNPKARYYQCETLIGREENIHLYRTYSGSNRIYAGDSCNILKFCPECFKSFQHQYGFVYFRTEFIEDIFCKEHQCPLIPISKQYCSCRLNLLDKLKSAYLGRCPYCGDNTWVRRPVFSEITRSLAPEVEFVGDKYPPSKTLYLANCAYKKIKHKLIQTDCASLLEKSLNPNELKSILRYSIGSNRPITDKNFTVSNCLNLIYYFLRYDLALFQYFMAPIIEVVKLNCNDVCSSKTSVFTNVVLEKNKNCAICDEVEANCSFKAGRNSIENIRLKDLNNNYIPQKVKNAGSNEDHYRGIKLTSQSRSL
jgi:hypothetical protein